MVEVRGTEPYSDAKQLVAYANGTFATVRELDDLTDPIQALAVDADGTNVYALAAENAVRHYTADAGSSFVTNPPLAGAAPAYRSRPAWRSEFHKPSRWGFQLDDLLIASAVAGYVVAAGGVARAEGVVRSWAG